MKLSQVINYFTNKLHPAYNNISTATNVAWWLLQKATGKSRAELLLSQEISQENIDQMASWVQDIVLHHAPVQYILGSVPFLDIDIIVKAPILIPRPETEQWCKVVIEKITQSNTKNFNLLDLCSGTGCIALAIAHVFPQAHIDALDISPAACALILENKKENKIDNCTVFESDLFAELPKNKKYSVITANPPYISLEEWHNLEPRVKNWESERALIAQQNGLHIIQKIIEQAPDYLDNKIEGVAQLWIEIGETQAEQVMALFEKNGYKEIICVQDDYGKNRVITGSL